MTRGFRKTIPAFVLAMAFVVSAVTLTGCDRISDAAAIKNAEQVFDRWQNSWNTHNLDALMDVAGEAVYWDVTLKQTISGDDFRAHAEGFLVAMPDVNFSLDEVIISADGKRIAWRWTWTGTFTGPLGEAQPTGKSVSLTGVDLLDIEGDKVVRVQIYWDQLDLLTQMGLIGG